MQSFFQQKSNRQQASRNASYLSTWFRSVWSTAQDAAAAAGTHRISSHSQQLSDTCVCTTTLCMLRAGTPMLTGKLPESPSRGAGYTSPLRASQQSIGMYKAAGMCVPTALSDQQHVPASKSMLAHFTFQFGHPANFSAGPTAKLEHVAERFSAFYSDLEQEKQVCALSACSAPTSIND